MSHDKEKKRKRHATDGEAAPRKKHASDGKLKLEHVSNDSAAPPVIANESSLTVPQTVSFKAYSRDATDELLLHSADHPRIDYTAREVYDGGAAAGKLRHYIGVLDPATNTMQMFRAKSLYVRRTLRSEEQEAREERAKRDLQGLSNRQALGMEFGTKKARKAIESLSQNAVVPRRAADAADELKHNPSASAVLASMAAAGDSAPTKEAIQQAVDDAKPRPKHNSKATEAKDVYPISEVVGETVMLNTKVRPWYDTINEGKEVKTHSRFVSSRLEPLVQADKVPRLKVAKYMSILLDFYGALGSQKGGGRKLPSMNDLLEQVGEPANVLDAIKQRFTDGRGHMNKWHVDNLMTHLAVYALIVDGFETDIFDLSEDLGLKPRDMKQFFNEIGAKTSRLTEQERNKRGMTKDEARNHYMARLELPLEFPKQRAPPQMRGRN